MLLERTDEEILECYSVVLANLKDMLNEDIMVLTTSRTHRIHYSPGKKMVVDLSKVGNVLSRDDPKLKAMSTGKIMFAVIDEDFFGFPFLSINYPVRNAIGEVHRLYCNWKEFGEREKSGRNISSPGGRHGRGERQFARGCSRCAGIILHHP